LNLAQNLCYYIRWCRLLNNCPALCKDVITGLLEANGNPTMGNGFSGLFVQPLGGRYIAFALFIDFNATHISRRAVVCQNQ